ncbi:MAG: amidohydrolase family protein [Pirellulaceae bacterium]|nr:amidohydrolase family protein [Pirellulaceae bacterium]
MPPNPNYFFAKYLVCNKTIIENGLLGIQEGRIVELRKRRLTDSGTDLGTVALLPAFLNTHTHLEFSSLSKPLGKPGNDFPSWISEIAKHKKKQGESLLTSKGEATEQGVNETLKAGISTVGETMTTPYDLNWYAHSPLRATLFFEMLALSPEKGDTLLGQAKDLAKRFSAFSPFSNLSLGLSPHAPYSVSQSLVKKITSLAKEERLPLMIHLAETEEELELLATHGGIFREFLEKIEFWTPAGFPKESRPLDYLEIIAQANTPTLIAHGNYLAKDDWNFLAEHPTMSVVYCPRTHAYFGHKEYPLREMLARKINVTLGTDSRASSPDLNLFADLKLVARQFPDILPSSLLSLVTTNAARALGLHHEAGSLEVGKRGDFLTVALPDSCNPDRVLDEILAPSSQVNGLWIGGEKAS